MSLYNESDIDYNPRNIIECKKYILNTDFIIPKDELYFNIYWDYSEISYNDIIN